MQKSIDLLPLKDELDKLQNEITIARQHAELFRDKCFKARDINGLMNFDLFMRENKFPWEKNELEPEYFPPNTKVQIYHNNETGEWLYSIRLFDDQENWIESFPTLKEAVDYCKENKFELVPLELYA